MMRRTAVVITDKSKYFQSPRMVERTSAKSQPVAPHATRGSHAYAVQVAILHRSNARRSLRHTDRPDRRGCTAIRYFTELPGHEDNTRRRDGDHRVKTTSQFYFVDEDGMMRSVQPLQHSIERDQQCRRPAGRPAGRPTDRPTERACDRFEDISKVEPPEQNSEKNSYARSSLYTLRWNVGTFPRVGRRVVRRTAGRAV